MNESQPSPERILQLSTGGWAAAIVGAAATHAVFAHLEAGEDTAARLAKRADISGRGAQALLDGLLGLGLIELHDGSYRNTPEASTYLIEDRPGYLGGFAKVLLTRAADWTALPEVIRTGTPLILDTHDTPDSTFFEQLVPAIAPTSAPAAARAAHTLRIADAGDISILDVGGGSGIYSAIWLGINPAARSTQIDWPGVNAVARKYVDRHGVSDRFTTIDGDLHTTEFGTAAYDIAIYSHIAHQESPADNVTTLTKLRHALKPGGTLLVSELIVDDDRTSPPFPLVFAAAMLLQSKHGTTWRRSDYQHWLIEAGFTDISFDTAPTPSTLIFARSA
jgi:ubiquinone/menaquinone biosynthesis C-methylase UbiE